MTDFQIDQEEQRVIVETRGSISEVARDLEAGTGLSVRVRGLSGAVASEDGQNAAVCIFQGIPPHDQVRGVMRMVSLGSRKTIFEGSLSGLPEEGDFGVSVREFGDLTRGGKSTGPVLCKRAAERSDRFFAFLGLMQRRERSSQGSAFLRFESESVQVHEMIGRSLVLERVPGDVASVLRPPVFVAPDETPHAFLDAIPEDDERAIAVGIVARSAGVLGNAKKVCACSGKTLWEEETIDVFDFLRRKN